MDFDDDFKKELRSLAGGWRSIVYLEANVFVIKWILDQVIGELGIKRIWN